MAETFTRLDRRKIRIAARGAEERRRHRRLPLHLHGRFLDSRHQEEKCRLIDISPGGAKVATRVPPMPGDFVVLLVDGLGRLDGRVLRKGDNWFSLQFAAHARKRDRLADAITWRFNMQRLGLEEDRAAPRKEGRGRAKIHFADGVVIDADVIDVSISGAAFACLERPRKGEEVRVGEMRGHVARIWDGGFAVAFMPPNAASASAA
ncbi:PilZ domain-containing protein [Hyphobacterium sp. HN65]|uniref:PilZ domain-containing protein n=1 Tax=Hyphobacterium lacteum TaxID=3116575 RepID=A0ABU7LTJ7_9PROT|nr:PilZ domain-containing protein [Hyphobacterium sp. HN65]MEE2527253.1 PilZ domain-containing protein [Hyphobacterium sp. HN65]